MSRAWHACSHLNAQKHRRGWEGEGLYRQSFSPGSYLKPGLITYAACHVFARHATWFRWIFSPDFCPQPGLITYAARHVFARHATWFRWIFSPGNSSFTKWFHFFWTYLNSILFVCAKCTIKGTSQNFNNFWLHLVYFVHLLICFELVDPWNWKALQMNSENVESWHAIIISPT